VFSEIFIKRELSAHWSYDYGWSALLAWAGAGSLILSFLFSLITCCAAPQDKYGNTRNMNAYDDNGFNYTPNNRYTPAYSSMPRGDTLGKGNQSAMENAGYQLR